MNTSVEELQQQTAIVSRARQPSATTAPVSPAATKTRPQTLLAIPVGACIALAIHFLVPKREPVAPTHYYPLLLFVMLGLGLLGLALYPFFEGLRKWMRHMCPMLGVATMTAGIWELATSCLGLLPLPYFPGPEGVFGSMVSDYKLLFDSTWHSLGPIPATAWIPLAMVIAPSALLSAVGLISLAVWFPVTMLTASGISSTRASYLDVARTLGARPLYLVFRVAIPAAMPNIFIGLFMGLGTSFLTLVVAENVGVKSGLGWYVSWAQGWAEYGKVYGALIIMAAFFSTIMTVLFKVRDRVLVWQKGVIKW